MCPGHLVQRPGGGPLRALLDRLELCPSQRPDVGLTHVDCRNEVAGRRPRVLWLVRHQVLESLDVGSLEVTAVRIDGGAVFKLREDPVADVAR